MSYCGECAASSAGSCLSCFVPGRWMQAAARPTLSASGLSAKTPCAGLENKENNQNVRVVLELERGTSHQVAVSTRRAGRAIASAGGWFSTAALQAQGRGKGRAGGDLWREYLRSQFISRKSLLLFFFFFFSSGKAKSS